MRRFFCVSRVVILVAFVGSAGAEAASPDRDTAQGHEAREVAAAYLKAMESGDLDAAEKLFAPQSSIFESGGQEGD